MPSEPARAYVWAWLPGATEPVVAGVLEPAGELLEFTYGRGYLERSDAIALYLPELPLQPGRQRPPGGMRVAGVIQDAGPDSWGQRVLMHRLLDRARRQDDPAELGVLTYLLESASNRTGALDFQASPEEYAARESGGTLEELLTAAERFDAGEPLSPELDAALLGGSTLGGARPKATLVDEQGRQLVAKFSSVDDRYPVVKAEGLALELARRVGLTVANTEVVECLGRDVLIAERFDRTAVPGERRMMVSALTILELDEISGRYATYYDLADVIRARFVNAKTTLRELFSRIVFNICIGNTDDHARNHSALWDGKLLELTPAYDLTPIVRTGGEARQAMAIGRDGYQMSQLAGCVPHAETYLLSPAEAKEIIDGQLEVIRTQCREAADAARLTKVERDNLWGSAILNRYALDAP
ncbi:MAG TPA: HipA domain-containing protein [Acidimicrobiales bacterium]|nr:HipA domain-containing protein [Acidimicrobiales bacterium]